MLLILLLVSDIIRQKDILCLVWEDAYIDRGSSSDLGAFSWLGPPALLGIALS